MEILSNLTLEIFNQPFLLEKRIELLIAVKRTGSISKAAKEVPMSYKAAWEAIEAMNNLSTTPIVQRETGGVGGGGTKLTPYGENLINTYEILRSERDEANKTVKSRGIFTNMHGYTDVNNKENLLTNFPFNSLEPNSFLSKKQTYRKNNKEYDFSCYC